MPTYAVSFLTTASTIVTVEAANEKEAREKADEVFSPPSVCHQCASNYSDDGSNSGVELEDWQQAEDDDGVWEI